jgi:FtsH-binding integral membrane protein
MIGFAWVAILSGFINDIIKLNAEARLQFPLVVHFHAAIFFGWLVLFTIQVILIRRNNFQLHKKLGIAGILLAVLVFILGVMTALITENVKYGTKYSDPAFVSIMLGDMLVFAGLASAGIYMRKNLSAHKRLMLIATLILTDAGFGRGLSIWLASFVGKPYWEYTNFVDAFWPFIVRQLSCPFTLIFMVGVYDIITRKRLLSA